MQLYLSRNGEQSGPYTPDEVRARMAAGEFKETDLGWYKGLQEWRPLPQALASAEAAADPFGSAPPVPSSSSGLAKASFIIGVVGVFAWIFLLGAAGMAAMAGHHEESPLMIVIGLAIFAGIFINVIGLILGIIPLGRTISNKWAAVTGLVLNLLQVGGVGLLMVIGLMAG